MKSKELEFRRGKRHALTCENKAMCLKKKQPKVLMMGENLIRLSPITLVTVP